MLSLLFIEKSEGMDYNRHYRLLIEKAKKENRSKSDGIYYEKHHIVMRSEGGTNNESNLVLLTPREHFVAHWLLHMEKPEEFNRALAFQLTGTINVLKDSKYTPSSRVIADIKERAAKLKSAEYKRRGYKPVPIPKSKRRQVGDYITTQEVKEKIKKSKKQAYGDKVGNLLKMDSEGNIITSYVHYSNFSNDSTIQKRVKTAANLGLLSEGFYWKYEKVRWKKRPKGWKGPDSFWKFKTQKELLSSNK